MGWLILLVVVGLLGWFVWRLASVPDSELEDSPKSLELAPGYRLEWLEGDEGGRGFFVRRDDGQRISWHSLPNELDGVESINVAGESYRQEELQSDSFAAGRPVTLVPEPDNEYDPNAVAVWDAEQRLQCGYIPASEAERIGTMLEDGEIERAIVMWETHKNGQRVSLRLLLTGNEVREIGA